MTFPAAFLVRTGRFIISAWYSDVIRCWPSSSSFSGRTPLTLALSIGRAMNSASPPVSSVMTAPIGNETEMLASRLRMRSSSQTQPRWKSGSCSLPLCTSSSSSLRLFFVLSKLAPSMLRSALLRLERA